MTSAQFSKIAQYYKEQGSKLSLVRLVAVSSKIGLKNAKDFVEEIFGFSNLSQSNNTGRILYNKLIKKYPEAKNNIENSELHVEDKEFQNIVNTFKYKEKIRK